MKQARGFSLTELIIVIVISSIIAAVVAPLIGNKFGAVSQSLERVEWVEQAEFAMFKIRQDMSNSVPNSVFVSEPLAGAGQVVEMLAAPIEYDAYAARYRSNLFLPYDHLDLSGDTSFDLLGDFNDIPNFVSIGTADATTMRTDWELYRSGGSAGTISAIDSASTTRSTAENTSPITSITLVGNHAFGSGSPYFRAYFSNGPIAYECDVSAGLLYRVSNYVDLSASLFTTRTSTAEKDRVIRNLLSCEFNFVPGSAYTPPMLYVRLEVGNNVESIQLVDAISLSNGS